MRHMHSKTEIEMKGKQSSELNDRCSKMFGIAQQAHMINIPFKNRTVHTMLCTR